MGPCSRGQSSFPSPRLADTVNPPGCTLAGLLAAHPSGLVCESLFRALAGVRICGGACGCSWVGVKLWSPLRGDLVWILGFLAVWGWCGFHAGGLGRPYPCARLVTWVGVLREALVWLAGPGWLLVFVGGGGAWPGFEIDRSEPSGSRVAIERAGHRPRTQRRPPPAEEQRAGSVANIRVGRRPRTYTRTQKSTTVNWRDDFGNRG